MKDVGNNKGFTLIEVLVTLVVLVILTTITMPLFTSIIQSNSTTSETNGFISYIMLARQEAVNRGFPVVICAKKFNQRECSGLKNWNNGWILFEDSDEDRNVDDEKNIIQLGEINNKDINLNSNSNNVMFLPNGFLSGKVIFNFTINRCVDENNKKIILSIPNKIETTSVVCD